MAEIEKSVFIAAPIEKVWAALTDAEAIRGWMGGDPKVKVDLKPDGAYRFFNGETTGRFTKIDAPRSLEYTWRQGEWDKAWADSIVGWKLKTAKGGTQVDLVHDGFPNEEQRAGHDEGWDLYWLGPMKEWLEQS